MKIMVSVLSFIVVVLSIVPCYAYHGDTRFQIETQHEEHSGKCDDKCDGNCSPFYSCGTCMGFISELIMSLCFIYTSNIIIIGTIHCVYR